MDERTTAGLDDEPPASPADALAIIQREQARHEPDIGPFFVIWGVTWLVIGIGWTGAGSGAWSGIVAGVTTAVVIVLGMIASAVYGSRIGRGVSGPSQTSAAMIGFGWTAAMLGTGVLVGGLARFGGPGVSVLAPALFVFVVGALYTLGGAFWRSVPDYALGLTLQVIAAVSVFVPVPWNSLLMGVGGGGALIAVGLWRRARR